MSATESLLVGMNILRGPPRLDEGLVTTYEECGAIESMDDNLLLWMPRPPYASYERVQAGAGFGCRRRGTNGGAPIGYATSGAMIAIAPRSFPLYPSCTACVDSIYYPFDPSARYLPAK